ncbi:MAG: Holliday junction resolvase RecU [Bacilli bacterium]
MKVKYPDPTINYQKPSSLSTQGMFFENSLNVSNEYYRLHNRAVIYKKPTPIQVTKVEYPARNKARIVEAFYRTPSTTDYNGVYRGKYIDYEAKETNNLRFAFKYIYPHQVDHLTKVAEHGGIAFIIIYFKKVNEIYIIDINVFNKYYRDKTGAKSLPLALVREVGIIVDQGFAPPIDYLAAVDEYYFK